MPPSTLLAGPLLLSMLCRPIGGPPTVLPNLSGAWHGYKVTLILDQCGDHIRGAVFDDLAGSEKAYAHVQGKALPNGEFFLLFRGHDGNPIVCMARLHGDMLYGWRVSSNLFDPADVGNGRDDATFTAWQRVRTRRPFPDLPDRAYWHR